MQSAKIWLENSVAAILHLGSIGFSASPTAPCYDRTVAATDRFIGMPLLERLYPRLAMTRSVVRPVSHSRSCWPESSACPRRQADIRLIRPSDTLRSCRGGAVGAGMVLTFFARVCWEWCGACGGSFCRCSVWSDFREAVSSCCLHRHGHTVLSDWWSGSLIPILDRRPRDFLHHDVRRMPTCASTQ